MSAPRPSERSSLPRHAAHRRPNPPHRLVLVRHGATASNRRRRFQGWSREGLSGHGRTVVRGTASRLAKLVDPARVWSSDLPRCIETARLLFPHARLQVDARLRELDFGAFEGWTHQEMLESGSAAYRAWLRDPDRAPPPGGEPLSSLRARVLAWWEERRASVERPAPGGRPGRGVLVAVTHGGPAGVLLRHLLGSGDPAVEFPPRPGGYVYLRAAPRSPTGWSLARAYLTSSPGDRP